MAHPTNQGSQSLEKEEPPNFLYNERKEDHIKIHCLANDFKSVHK